MDDKDSISLDCPSNSKKSRVEEKVESPKKEIHKVTTGEVKIKKRGLGGKIRDLIVPQDVDDMGDYLLTEVLIPSLRKAIWDAGTNGLSLILGVDTRNIRGNAPGTRFSYNSIYPNQNRQPQQQAPSRREVCDYDNIVVGTRVEADDILAQMDALIGQYGTCSVSDLYEMLGVTGPYTGNRYGWMDIHTARAERVFNGWRLALPRALVLDR